jgi:hypothetical protein
MVLLEAHHILHVSRIRVKWEIWVQISVSRPAIIFYFSAVPHLSRNYLKLDNDRFLPDPLQFIILTNNSFSCTYLGSNLGQHTSYNFFLSFLRFLIFSYSWTMAYNLKLDKDRFLPNPLQFIILTNNSFSCTYLGSNLGQHTSYHFFLVLCGSSYSHTVEWWHNLKLDNDRFLPDPL